MADVDPASFRDPDASVFVQDGRIFRGLSDRAARSHIAATDVGRRLMATRKVGRDDYTRELFMEAVAKRFTVEASTTVSATRDLFHLRRN